MRTVVLWGCLLSLLLYSGSTSAFESSLRTTPSFKFTMTSLRNKTGHWTAQIQLEHREDQEYAAAWEVDVDQTVTRQRDGTESVLIVATITTPPKGTAIGTPEVRRPAPTGYRKLSDFDYFKAFPEANKWIEARDICEQQGAHLAIINSEAEAKFVSSLWNFSSDWAFIGTHDLYQEGKYVTIHNQTLEDAGYNKWFPGEPNGGTTENCGVINRNTLLGNFFCPLPLPFFCEFEA